MSAFIILPGRPTSDPQIMQSKNGNTTYTTLDIACSQRGQDGKNESVFYSCFFNSFLADRLIKAGVKKATGLIIYGELELHPFIHQKGQNQGKPNAGPSITVKDWQFAPSTRSDDTENPAGNPQGNANGAPQNGYGQQGGYNPQGGYQTQNGYSQPGGAPQNGYSQAGGTPQNNYSQQQGAYSQQGNAPQNGYPQQNNGGQQGSYGQVAGYQAPPAAAGGYAAQNTASGNMQNGYPNDGFTQVPESQAGRLPFAA